jgi:Zn2+/Cd2+-exporting ATPase
MKTYKLQNLDCANCALKIENVLKQLESVKKVSVNFATETLTIDTEDFNTVKRKIKSIEPDIEIIDEQVKEEKSHSSSTIKRKLLPLFIYFLIFIAGLIFEEQLHNYFYAIFEYILFGGIFIITGWKVLYAAARNIVKGKIFDENFLMTIATLGAIFIHALPEAAGVMLFYKLGLFFEELSVARSRKSIASLIALKPDYARVKRGKMFEEVAPEQVQVDDEIRVNAGERVPLDGIIIAGESAIDLSALTGESVPAQAGIGDMILSGSIALSGALTIKVTKSFKESSLSRILELVENAVHAKAPTEKFITTFARYYTPIVVSIAIAIAAIPPFLPGMGDFQTWLYRALVLLVISCPCALVLSIPLGYFAGIGVASKKGILIKGSNYIDALNKLGTVVFDKTGTLTMGVFEVTEITGRNGFKKDEILKIAAYAESFSHHPIAVSIKKAYAGTIDESHITAYKEIAGYGIKAKVSGHTILMGNDKFLHQENIAHEDCDIEETIVYVVIDNTYAGYIIISDREKPDAARAIRGLKELGIKQVYMLTGDNKKVADRYADRWGIDTCYAELLPGDKVKQLEQIKENNKKKIAFVGDGLNDGPVIASADIGFAMGKRGTDLAVETADVVLMTDAPSKVVDALQVSRKTKKIVLQNIFLALGIKIIFIAFGAMGVAGMWEAVFADVGVTLLAVLNTLRISS